jgi:hypothetical protein
MHASSQVARKEPAFPPIFSIRGRNFGRRSDFNRYKAQLITAALGVDPVEPDPSDPDEFVPLGQIARELGVSRRTAGQRLREAQLAQAAEQPAA